MGTTSIGLLALLLSFNAFASSSGPEEENCMVDGRRAWTEPSTGQEDAPVRDAMAVDIVGDTSNSSSATGRAKGNSYQVDMAVTLEEMEFWLSFTTTQTITTYVFECPQEFGTYTEVYRASESVVGTGPGWYSSGPVSIDLESGYHYIIAVSWDGTLTYYYDTGDSQAVSFGYHTHGYALGYDPLPSSFESTSNDQAIYHQRLTTSSLSLSPDTWAGIKTVFR
ncbi:MAG: hypothetical protein AVO35_05880 [Candidatus Aegiribacteria sp. MLS_C]|nr:MAG: hypothetical protein AVO35_05880 [Candidatus Aegiribacteria sp. MLS_C]